MALRIQRFLAILQPQLRTRLPFSYTVRTYAKVDRRNPTKFKLHSPGTLKGYQMNDDMRALQNWIQWFTLEKIPQHLCTVTFSRSSGPGGQNVNKYTQSYRLNNKIKHKSDDTNECERHGGENQLAS